MKDESVAETSGTKPSAQPGATASFGSQVRNEAMKREFILAGAIFVGMAIVGTGFGLWYAVTYAPNRAPQTLDSRR